jgi:dimethylamine monooxygenase subunit A
MLPILQKSLPEIVWTDPKLSRLPGVLPLVGDGWISADDAFAAQMAERDRLIAGIPGVVHAMQERARPAAEELYARVLGKLAVTEGYRVGTGSVLRPDGVEVVLQPEVPLLTLGRLVQEDLCLMQHQGDEYVLSGAVLCFPASWSLDEKLGRALVGIHARVAHYTDDLARRVQRMFEVIRVYTDPVLHQPRREGDPRLDRRDGKYLRSERQCFLRLPESDAVLFSIHTYTVLVADLPDDARAAMAGARL